MKFCPTCNAEYRDDASVCSDDGATLIDSARWKARQDEQRKRSRRWTSYTAVLSLADRFEAEELADALHEEGIQAALVSNKTRTLGTLTTPGPEIHSIVVPDDHAARARHLLAEWRSGLEATDGSRAAEEAESKTEGA